MLIRVLLTVALLTTPAWGVDALPIVRAAPTTIPVGGPTLIDLFINPNGTDLSGYTLLFSISSTSDLTINSVDASGDVPGDCGSIDSGPNGSGQFSYDASCATSTLTTEVRIGIVSVTGLLAGGELRMDASTALDTSMIPIDIPLSPLLLVVVPEPNNLSLFGAPLLLMVLLGVVGCVRASRTLARR